MDWNAVVDQIGPALYRYFSGAFPVQLADDLTQETLVRLVRKVESGQYRSEQGSLLKYAYGIARFVKLEAIKALPRERASDEEAPSEETIPAEALLDDKRRIARLRQALNHLPEVQREILLLILDRDLALAEVAALLEIPVGTIKSHVHRAKAELGRQIQLMEAANVRR